MMVSDPNVFMLHNADSDGREGLSERPNAITTGRNSGYQAINIAVLAGAKKILLLGYDMRFKDGKSHWFGDHPVKTPEHSYKHYAQNFKAMVPQLQKAGVSVINCTPGSLINCFPFSTVKQELQ